MNEKKALIAMSGGVDSSVAAYLTMQEGFDCAGATMRLFDGEDKNCGSSEAVNDARSVADRLIPKNSVIVSSMTLLPPMSMV